uniref:Myotubularin related protein 3 n=1 Tax=Cynoglossus semilaevis TaxID=244447 RepID=A0A3P8VQ26_CYNSE
MGGSKEEGQSSLECIQANQIFPKKSPILEEENMQVPFPELHGEFTEYVGRAEDAIIAMSNYRLHIKFKESIINVPLQLIESVECRDMFQLHLTCKDCKVVRYVRHPSSESAETWFTLFFFFFFFFLTSTKNINIPVVRCCGGGY